MPDVLSSKPSILLACNFSDRLKGLLAQRYNVLGPMAFSSSEALPPGASVARALITKGDLKTDAALLDALPNLGLISFFGTGYEGIAAEEAASRGLVVTHSPGANASSVADFAMGLALASARQILQADQFIRDGKWGGNGVVSMPPVAGLTAAKMGIYGLGAIGRKVAARAAAFEMQVGYYSRSPKPDVPYDFKPSLLALAEWADILVIAVRADASNYHAVDRDILAALGPKGHLINISRGIAVDTEALIEALEQETIAGAALDVFENEPNVPQRLIASPRVILTPHVAYGTLSARNAQEDMVLANLDAFFAQRPVPNPAALR